MDRRTESMRVLICDRIGLRTDQDGCHDFSEVVDFIKELGGVFHIGSANPDEDLPPGRVHFYYQPDLSDNEELINEAADGKYDAVIAAATAIPAECVFSKGGVRIGAGTGNMKSLSWGGPNGEGGEAPLMNTPGYNSRATAHMVFKAILRMSPNLPLEKLHQGVLDGKIDTRRDLKDYPTDKIEGKKLLVLGYGNIGRDVAKLGKAFGMHVSIFARKEHQEWIEAQGYQYCSSLPAAAFGADFISIHLGLGREDRETGRFANQGLIDHAFFEQAKPGVVIVNYDRGEIIDTAALETALATGKVAFAAIDADIFVNRADQGLSGPLAPYVQLASEYPEQLLLLPHAVADTDHTSRVEGAKQAVRQIFDALCNKWITNLVGNLPKGYRKHGTKTAPGVGFVQIEDLKSILNNPDMLSRFRILSWQMAEIWQGLTTHNVEYEAKDLILAINRYITLVNDAGIAQPTTIEPLQY